MPRRSNLALAVGPALPTIDKVDEEWPPEPKKLDRPVISCKSAAWAKRVPLEHELKSLLVVCDGGYLVAHVRGNRRLSLRAVKNMLQVQQARLADPADLPKFGVTPGTLYPFNDALWSRLQLIDKDVLEMDWVTTNYGNRRQYVIFPPSRLLEAENHRVGDFEE